MLSSCSGCAHCQDSDSARIGQSSTLVNYTWYTCKLHILYPNERCSSSHPRTLEKFESRAAESKQEVTEAVAKWKELLKTDPEAAKVFQDSRIKKKDAEDAVAQ